MLPARLRLFLALGALWVAVFGFGLALDDRLEGPWALSAPTLLRLGALNLPPGDAWEALRAGSALFLHSDALHLGGNLAAWALILATWPRRASLRSLILIFLFGGLLAAIGSIVAYAQVGGLSVGPSGGLCACLASALSRGGGRPRQALLWLLLCIAFLVGGQLSGGDQGAHVAGLLVGGLIGLLLRSRQAARLPPDRDSRSLGLAAGESPL